jgi:hypothetical protein
MSAELVIGVIGAVGTIGGLIVGAWYGRRSTQIAEAEHEQRQRERHARAKLAISVECVNMERRSDGVYVTGGNAANVRLKIAITNSGERKAGRGIVEVDAPTSISELYMRWSDAGGRELPELATVRASRLGDRNLLTRQLDAISRDFPEVLYVTMPTNVPGEYAIQVRVQAEHADAATADFNLRIEQGGVA